MIEQEAPHWQSVSVRVVFEDRDIRETVLYELGPMEITDRQEYVVTALRTALTAIKPSLVYYDEPIGMPDLLEMLSGVKATESPEDER